MANNLYRRYIVRVTTIKNGNKRFEVKDNYWGNRHDVFGKQDGSLYTREEKAAQRGGGFGCDSDAPYKKALQEAKDFTSTAQVGKVYQISTFDDPFGAIAEYKEVPKNWFDC